MAVGSGKLAEIFPVAGFRLGTTSADIKTPGRNDLVLMELAAGSAVAAVFTGNAFCAAPVQVAKNHLAAAGQADECIRYLITNTGNANAGTGASGLHDALTVCKSVAGFSGVEPFQVLPFSTGVIGEPLLVDKITEAIPSAFEALDNNTWLEAAEGILTTDTRPKAVSRQLKLGGKLITISGISKGAGMIKPNMATMLAYIATDACVEQTQLQDVLGRAVEKSFNRITVDGDTSTNDSLVLVATGASEAFIMAQADIELFEEALESVCVALAQAIIKDGEGATKFIEVIVSGGIDYKECMDVAYAVAESPLVKTALFASDPNWGRVLAVVGRAGVPNLAVDDVKIWFDDVLIAEQGGRALSYTEVQGQRVMDQEEFAIKIDLARGDCTETIWTTDLSYDYIRINAEYRT
ncbi:MAG: bifunctional glutamate N-acetyltransferase/amino-acid acetyltransferase ArgJ [Porticoccaceae bacterium]|nr:bifunctional glutamate N-acetyltransferase/amino-acid acetyltransferase ArgJ [Porticoccaceae bacterium]